MQDRPLPARFDEFDADEARRHAAYLDAQAATPFWRERKRLSYSLLALRPGMTVLDVGCGTGGDVRAMASLVAPGGEAVGVDFSEALVAEATARGGAGVSFVAGDAAALPFEAERFDAVRVERVLQHLGDPAAAVAEMRRVARPGAAIVAIEPNWESLRIEGEPRRVGEAVRRRWAQAIRSPRVGAELERLMAAAGLEAAEVRSDESEIGDLAFAEQQFALSDLALGEDGADEWLEDLRVRAQAGRFRACVTYVTLVAVVP